MCQDAIEDLRRKQVARTEEVYAAALTGGMCGVSVIDGDLTFDQTDTGDMTIRMKQTVRVDPRVPYGERYMFPSETAYEAWAGRNEP